MVVTEEVKDDVGPGRKQPEPEEGHLAPSARLEHYARNRCSLHTLSE